MTEDSIAAKPATSSAPWKLALKILISAVLVILIVRMLNFQELGRVFAHADWLWIALGFLLFVVAQVLRTVRWHMLIACHRPGLRFGVTVNSMFVGLFFNMFLPAELGGDVIRGLWLDKEVGSRSATFASVLADRIMGMMTMALLAAWSIVVGARHISRSSTALVAGLCVVLLLITAVAASERIANFLIGLPIIPKRFDIAGRLRRFTEALRLYRTHKRVVLYALVVSLLFQAAVYMSYFILAQGLALPAPMWSFFAFVPLITIITMVPASLNGIGAREMGYAVFFAEVGLSSTQAVSLSLASYAFLVATSLIGGVVYALQKRAT